MKDVIIIGGGAAGIFCALSIMENTKEAINVTILERLEKIGKKIREAQLEKIPYMLIIGDKEVEEGTVAIRSRKDGDVGSMTQDEFIAKVVFEDRTHKID